MFSSSVIGLVVGVVLLLFLTDVLKFMGAIPSIMDMAKIYADIFIASTIFSTINVTSGNIAVSQGAAVATLISQLVTGLIYLFYFKGGKSFLEIKLSNFKPISAIYKEILKVGISMFLLQIFSSISISKISSSASLYGEEAIAAMGIVLRIVTLGTKDILKYELFQKRFLVNLLRKTFPVVLLDSSIAGVHKSFQAKKKKPYQLLLSSS